jgi:dTMP kinase
MTRTGLFIAFEGGEGAGKSTQSTLLEKSLIAGGHRVLRTREPGGTQAAEAIREIVLDPAFAGLDSRAEALLFAAARGDHAAHVIGPALDAGIIVICDRYIDSSAAYQGAGRQLGIERVEELSLWATGNLVPDLTIVLDIDPAIGLSRVDNPDRLEAEPESWHRTVRAAFLSLAERDPQRYLIFPADTDADELARLIIAAVQPLLLR